MKVSSQYITLNYFLAALIASSINPCRPPLESSNSKCSVSKELRCVEVASQTALKWAEGESVVEGAVAAVWLSAEAVSFVASCLHAVLC